jgi:DNA-binding NarL/FixJ family response regulator
VIVLPVIPEPPRLSVVLVAVDHDVRWALRDALERHGLQVVGEGDTCEDAIAAVLRLEPALVVIDLGLPRYDDALRRLRAWAPETATVVLADATERDRVTSALELGAAGVLRTGTRLSVLAERARAFAEEHRRAS